MQRVPYDKETSDSYNEGYVREIISRTGFIGTILVNYIQNGQSVAMREYNVPTGNLGNWWNRNHHNIDWRQSSDETIFEARPGGYFVVTQITDAVPLYIAQDFRHGATNCILTPIRDYFLDMAKKNTPKKSEYSKKAGQAQSYMGMYENGVPESQLEVISKALKVKIVINDILGGNLITKTVEKPYKVFTYINNRQNHAELVSIDETISITRKQYKRMVIDEGDYYTNQYIIKGQTKYEVTEPEHKKIRDWEKSQGLHTLDYLANPELSDFIRKGCHYGGCVDITDDPFENIQSLKHIDHKKSYYNYRDCEYYKKYRFPHLPTQYRHLPKDFPWRDYSGFWLISNIEWENLKENTKLYLSKLNIYNAADVFTTPELVYMESLGLKFDVKIGAWGHNNMDIDMTGLFNIDVRCEKCKEKKVINCEECSHKKAPYKIWAGQKASIRLESVINLKGTEQMSKNLAHKYGSRIKYDSFNQCIRIATAKDRCLHSSHITAYILSYSRIQILQQLMKIPYENARRVELDAIFYDAICDTPVPESFSEKPIQKRGSKGSDSYYSSYDRDHWNPEKYHEFSKYRIIYASGAGGTGKSYFFINEAGLIEPCYVAKENKIIADKKEEYALTNTCTVAKLLGRGFRGLTTTLIVDECSKLNKQEVIDIIALNEYSQVIFLGDICQLRPFGPEIKHRIPGDYSKFFQIEFTINYRCKCPKLLVILNDLRRLILAYADEKEILEYFIEALKDQKGTDDLYQVNEYIITSRQDKIDYYTEKHKNKPTKWLVKKNTQHGNNGDIVIGERPPNSELKHAFTAHATQGITIKSPNKLYIDPNNMFAPEMAYTIISRVEYLDQVILLPLDFNKEKKEFDTDEYTDEYVDEYT